MWSKTSFQLGHTNACDAVACAMGGVCIAWTAIMTRRSLQIAVNNRKYLKFKHRISPNSLDHLKIVGGVKIVMLRYF